MSIGLLKHLATSDHLLSKYELSWAPFFEQFGFNILRFVKVDFSLSSRGSTV